MTLASSPGCWPTVAGMISSRSSSSAAYEASFGPVADDRRRDHRDAVIELNWTVTGGSTTSLASTALAQIVHADRQRDVGASPRSITTSAGIWLPGKAVWIRS